jgi:type II secretory pathway component PulF
MAKFRYTAADSEGASREGEIEAASLAEARAELQRGGFDVRELVEVSVEPATLAPSESEELARQLAQVGSSRLPLAAGLRAAAAECGQRRVEASLRQIADRIDQGQSLETVVDSSPELYPRHVGGLVVAAARTGKLGSALAELLEHQRQARALRQEIARGFAYPAFVACLAVLILTFLMLLVSDTFEQMFIEFQLELPLPTRLLFWWRDYGVGLVVACASILLIVTAIVRLTVGRVRWMQLKASVPIVGPLSYWSALAEWCSLLSLLLKHQIPLADALLLSADGVENSYVGQMSRTLAERSAGGQTLSQLLASGRPLPVSIAPLIRWGEKVESLPEAFSTGKEIFGRRVRIRACMLHSILPPSLFIVLAATVGLVVIGLFTPLVSLISGLR